jgi:hypothetical protein
MAFAAFIVTHPEHHTIRHMCKDYINMSSPKYSNMLSLWCMLSNKKSHIISELIQSGH